jgi:histone H3/H4
MADESKYLFVKSAVKEVIKAQNCKTSKELLEDNALNDMVRAILVKACQRARENGRTIVFPRDI